MNTFSILFENDEILLVNKPFGCAVQGGEGVAHPLDEELSREKGYKVHLVHRLDKDTSGILIVAKNPQAASKWTKLIGTKEVQKEYVAVCTGMPEIKGKKCTKGVLSGTVEAHGRTQSAETFFTVEKSVRVELPALENASSESKADSKEALSDKAESKTEVKPDSKPDSITLSLVKLKLGTGRMHQLRIQLAKAMCPICADDQHGNFKINKKLRKLGIKKLCLCSYKVTLPLNGKQQVFTVDLPEHMQKAVDTYFSGESAV